MNLEEKMDPEDFHKFTTQDYFTIRRSDKFRSSIWSDMTIEQTLMKSMKCCGGLTHGRGITDSVLSRWILGMVHLLDICEQVDKNTDITSATTKQHVDLRPTRTTRDNQDIEKLTLWLTAHPPFTERDVIMSISTAIVGHEDVNCHLAREVGITGIRKIVGENFKGVKLLRKNVVVTLAACSNGIKMGDNKVTIDLLTVFQGVCIAK